MSKISRERVGVEVDKMFKGPNPVLAMKFIRDFGIYDMVFSSSSASIGITKDPKLYANQAVDAMTTMQWYEFKYAVSGDSQW